VGHHVPGRGFVAEARVCRARNGVATSVIMPLIEAPAESGIMNHPAGIPEFSAVRSAMAMEITTTPVEDITEPTRQRRTSGVE